MRARHAAVYALVVLASVFGAWWAWHAARQNVEKVAVRSAQALRELTAVNANGGERALRAGPGGGSGASVRMGR